MKEKKNNGLLIICGILIFGIALLIGYYAGNITSSKENNGNGNEPEQQEPIEVKNMSLDEANQILEKFGLNKKFGCETIVDSKYNDIYKALVAIDNLDESLIKEENCSNYYSETLQSYIPNTTIYKGNIGECRNTTKVIDYNEVNKVYKKLYNEEMPKKSLNAMNIGHLYYDMYYYNAEKNIFTREVPGNVGGTCAATHIRQLNSAEVVGNTLTIKFQDYQSDYFSNGKYYFMTNGYAETITCSTQEECINIIKTHHMDKLPEYEVTFEKINGDYVFKNLIRVLS